MLEKSNSIDLNSYIQCHMKFQINTPAKRFLLPSILIAFLLAVPGYAQVITDVPPNERNTRFLDDSSIISMRPGLSISGFSREGSGGLGLQQILNLAFESNSNSEYQTVSQILDKAKESFSLNPQPAQVETTTNILQYLAFEALASLILEQNGVNSQQSINNGLNIREHSDVMDELKNALATLTANDKLVTKLPGETPFDEYLDALRSYNNTARAIDLYLAIENAYAYFNLDESPLLNEGEKRALMNQFRADIDILYNDGLKRVYELGGSSATEDVLEAGNRPLKGYFALGYASMSAQADQNSEREILDGYIDLAIALASEPADEDERQNYWMYQTGNGQRFWAEGPYYLDFTLKDAIIFWHAFRNNQDLEPSFDPFFNDWLLNPARWLADISTPDGSVPPLDDSNKKPIQSANLLRWSGEYGDEEIGRIFTSVYDKVSDYHGMTQLEDQYFLVEVAIPFHNSGGIEVQPLTNPNEQQLISRTTDSRDGKLYISLTGEKGESVTNGEGHEQPDQLQLLFYRDQYSFLTDPGYDSGSPQTNSTWNGYVNTNTMQYDASEIQTSFDFVTKQNEGGLESPYASFFLLRKVSIHNEAELFYEEPAPSVEILSGRVQLNYQNPLPAESIYHRTVLVVKGGSPYLIDINDITAETGRNDFVMRYYGNSNQSNTQDGWFFWDHSTRSFTSPDDRLFLYTVPLIGNFVEENQSIEIQEYENRNSDGDKNPYPIIRKSYISTEETDRFATAAILKVDDSIPSSEPQFISDSQNLSFMVHPLDSETIDLFVFATQSVNRKRTLSIRSGPLEELDFSFPANETIGFSRLNQSGNSWSQDDEYTVNLSAVTAPDAPTNLTVSIESGASGPAAILNWDEPAENSVKFYEVWKQTRDKTDLAEGPAALIATPTTNTYSDISITNLPPGEFEQRWFVKAVNSDSLVSEPSNTTDWMFIDTSSPPDEFALFNPFPNPMRQTGKIKYQLAEQANVTLQIFDLLGRPVKTILSETQTAGIYTNEWDSNGMAAGIYILQLKAEPGSGTPFQKSVKVSVIK